MSIRGFKGSRQGYFTDDPVELPSIGILAGYCPDCNTPITPAYRQKGIGRSTAYCHRCLLSYDDMTNNPSDHDRWCHYVRQVLIRSRWTSRERESRAYIARNLVSIAEHCGDNLPLPVSIFETSPHRSYTNQWLITAKDHLDTDDDSNSNDDVAKVVERLNEYDPSWVWTTVDCDYVLARH